MTKSKATNPSGITPLLDRVLVLPDEIEEKTQGGIYIPDPVQEHHQMAQAAGTLVAVGPDAFTHSRTEVYREGALSEVRIERWDPDKTPKPGDRVLFAKYGGLQNPGKDGKVYRLLNDRDITAAVEEDVKYTGIQSRKKVQ